MPPIKGRTLYASEQVSLAGTVHVPGSRVAGAITVTNDEPVKASAVTGVPSVPDILAGVDAMAAALAYAKSGFYVLPILLGKHPGSVVGKR